MDIRMAIEMGPVPEAAEHPQLPDMIKVLASQDRPLD